MKFGKAKALSFFKSVISRTKVDGSFASRTLRYGDVIITFKVEESKI